MEHLDDKIKAFLSVGRGDGSDYGSGYGSGDGRGDGRGYGSGYGRGYGRGDGRGDGSGDGIQVFDGSGDGSGYGRGDGIQVFDGHKVYVIDGIPTCIEQVHGNYAVGFVFPYFSKKKCYIARVDNSFAHGATLRQAVEDATDKALRAKPLEERIADTVKAHPDPNEIIPNAELFKLHNVLTGSCEFGRRQFCDQHGVSLDDAMTMCRFMELTVNAYGGETIRQLAEAYNFAIK